MFVNGSGQNEQSLSRTFHRCFLLSFSSFGWRVSEEKIKMWKVNGRWTPSDGKSSHCLWRGELKKHKNSVIEVFILKKPNMQATSYQALVTGVYWSTNKSVQSSGDRLYKCIIIGLFQFALDFSFSCIKFQVHSILHTFSVKPLDFWPKLYRKIGFFGMNI